LGWVGPGRVGQFSSQLSRELPNRLPKVDQSDAQVHYVYRLVGPFLYNRRKIKYENKKGTERERESGQVRPTAMVKTTGRK
jgi:hypothetical protein